MDSGTGDGFRPPDQVDQSDSSLVTERAYDTASGTRAFRSKHHPFIRVPRISRKDAMLASGTRALFSTAACVLSAGF